MTKRNFFRILLAGIFLLSLAGCLSDNNIDVPVPPTPYDDDGERQTVSLQLLREGAASRGVSRPVCDG